MKRSGPWEKSIKDIGPLVSGVLCLSLWINCVTISGSVAGQPAGWSGKPGLQRAKSSEKTRPETSLRTAAPADSQKQQSATAAYGKLPLSFEANMGQTDPQVKFLSRGPGYQMFLTSSEAVFDLSRPRPVNGTRRPAHAAVNQDLNRGSSTTLRMKLVGGNAGPAVKGEDELEGKSNYFIGNDPSSWQIAVPNYARVRYDHVYPGIDLIYYGNQRQLEYDLVVSPGASPDAVALGFEGASQLRIEKTGDLRIGTRGGSVLLRRPFSYQDFEGERRQIATSYVIRDQHVVGLRVSDYDHSRPLVIDPVLVYATYLGGSSFEFGVAIAVDSDGNAYVTGETNSNNFPTANAFQPARLQGDARHTNVFVAKLNAAGSALVYSTYLGGHGIFAGEIGNGIAVDSSGSAFVGGTTNSSDFPTTTGVVRPGGASSGQDGFVTRLTPSGALAYSTYVTGGTSTEVRGLAIDSAGNAYVVGGTGQFSGFPIINGAQTTAGTGSADAFLLKLNPTATQYLYGTYIGGSDTELASGVAVDNSGRAYVAGYTFSANFPTRNPLQATFGGGGSDAFVAKYDTTLSGSASLVYATYLGGSGSDSNEAGFAGVESHAYIAIDSSGNAYVAGPTRSSNFPTTAGAFQTTFAATANLFVTKINPAGSALVYSTYLGGSGYDIPTSLALDSSGNAYVTGLAASSSFPLTSQLGPYRSNNAFVSKLNAAGSALIFSTFLGGNTNRTVGYGIAVDGAGSIYVTGDADNQTDFPTTSTAFQKTLGGDRDAFVTKIGAVPTQPFSILNISPKKGGDTGMVTVSVVGTGFSNGAALKLTRTGQPDIAGQSVNVTAGGTVLKARFDLTGKATGSWNVVIVNSDSTSATLADGFTIETGAKPQIWVSLLGRSAIRTGREQTFYVNYGNRGNVDGVGVSLIIDGIPSFGQMKLGFDVASPPQIPGQPVIDYSNVPKTIDTQTTTGRFVSCFENKLCPEVYSSKMLPLYIPLVPAGSSKTLSISLTIPTGTSFSGARIRAAISQPLSQVPNPAGAAAIVNGKCQQYAGLAAADPNRPDDISNGVSCVTGLFSSALGGVLGILIPTNCLGSAASLMVNLTQLTLDTGVASGNPDAGTAVSATQVGYAAATTVLKCLGETAFPEAKVLLAVNNAITSINNAASAGGAAAGGLAACGGMFADTLEYLFFDYVQSTDPNDKVGAQGIAAERFISGAEPLRYAVFFENLATASAPAQEVVVTDQLDPAKVDLSTFGLDRISFGATTVTPPPGLSSYNIDVDLRPARNLIARVTAGLNQSTGLVTWRFQSIDPATGQPTTDPLAGFLPPNKTAPEGEGKVLFTVGPKPGSATGTQLTNKARIVFDANAPIDTPQWLNTIDNSKPTSKVAALPATQGSVLFTVNWSGADTGSGIQDYRIYVSENGGPFTLWLNDTTATSGTFAGRPGKSYAFYSLARDLANNQENAKTAGEANTSMRTDITNAIDDARLFVWQHYLDFLNRPADADGLNFWTNQTTNCGAADPLVCRINVSASFYLSIEFQNTGFYAIRLQRAAFGRKSKDPATRMTYQEVLNAASQLGQGVVVLAAGWEQALEANKQAYAEQVVTGSDFVSRYPLTMTAAQYVDALIATAAVPVTTAERNAAITAFGSGNTTGRAAALRAIAEAAQLTQAGTEKGSNSAVNREFREAFVLMQFYGYLRRNPTDPPDNNDSGYQFWLQKLNDFGGDYIAAEMVKAFISSTEYRQRFTQ